jgi:hypothetical protein
MKPSWCSPTGADVDGAGPRPGSGNRSDGYRGDVRLVYRFGSQQPVGGPGQRMVQGGTGVRAREMSC